MEFDSVRSLSGTVGLAFFELEGTCVLVLNMKLFVDNKTKGSRVLNRSLL